MSKLYFEMNDKEKQLNLIAGNLDYAYCVFSEGLSGTGKFNLENEEVRKLQNRIGDHVMKAYEDINTLLKAVEEKENYLPEDKEDTEENEEEIPFDLRRVENVRDLSVLNNYQVENINETVNEEGKKGVLILFKKKLEGGNCVYRELSFSGDGNQYMSDES